ncbi:hemerythrin domain-containing protein [Janibacter sp. GXQ6167]|uniref:hemerythrin domain-containing protein n=1 Tax=Janibacter sp. GXQ6167 TaxID=3240791 RepID=UPI0035252119
MTTYEIPRPISGDIVDLILDDHRLMEDLLRQMRGAVDGRDTARLAFAELHVAHARAEEELVLPGLRRRRAITAHEQEHGEEEHAEGHQELLTLMQCVGTDTKKYEEAVEALSSVVYHHLCEEELDVLGSAREDVSATARTEMGEKWAARRNELLAEGCGSIQDLERIVSAAEKQGLLDD